MLEPVLDAGLKWLTRDRLSVFLFHAVPVRSPDVPPDLVLQDFERLLDYAQERFHIIPLHDAVQALKANKLPPNAACLTFDDGYASWFDGVVPLLKRRGLHATFYITTGQFNGLPTWHERLAKALAAMRGPRLQLAGLGLYDLPLITLQDRQHSYGLLENFLKYQDLSARDELLKRLEQVAGIECSTRHSMTVDQLRQLDSMGFEVGAHTHQHPILSLCDDNLATQEIGAVREKLQHLTGGRVRSFAYPNGRPGVDYTAQHVAIVKRAGYEHAVSTHWGAARAGSSIYEIPRFTPWGHSPARMTWQIMRNVRVRTRVLGDRPHARPVAMVVENGSGFGGAVKALDTLLEGMNPDRAQFHVVTNMPLGPFEQHPAVQSAHVISDRRINTRALSDRVRKSGLPGIAKRALFFSLGRVDDLFNRLPYLISLAWLASKTRPDVMHGNNEPASNREAMLVAKLLRIPYVQHVRGSLTHVAPHSWMLTGASVFVPVSRWLAGDLMRLGVPAFKIRQIYDAVELTVGEPNAHAPAPDIRQSLDLPPETVLVAMIGMLVSWKGQDLFIDAVNKLGATGKPVAFLLVGGTPERGDQEYADNLLRQAEQLGVTECVHFLGKVNDVATCLPQINVVISASTEPEPLGLVMLEAMDAGCIFIAPAFGAATEVVANNDNGLLFKPRDAASLADVMRQAIDLAHAGDARGAAMRNRARQTVRAQFDPSKCCDATLRTYQTVM